MGLLASTAAGTRAWSVAIAIALCALITMVVPHAAEAATGSISGTVTNSTSQGLGEVCVSVHGIGHDDDGIATTDESGHYEVGELDAGNYRVLFEACGADDYVSEYYDNRSETNATLVPVTDGQETPEIDASLEDGGRISGQVTTAGTGHPLSGACVEVTGPTSATVTSGALGTYTVRNLAPGDYTVAFRGCTAGNFVSEFYDDVTELASAEQVAVAANAVAGEIDAALAPAGSISGTVTNAGGSPQPNVCVKAHRVGSNAVVTADTGPSGTYRINRLATGAYKIEFADCLGVGLVDEFWNDKPDQATADEVQVEAPTDTPNIDAQLAIDSGEEMGSISGQVTDASLAPVAGVCVTAHPASTGGVPVGDTTDGSGNYEIPGLAEGEYLLEFASCGAPGPVYIAEYYDDVTDIDLAEAVFVAAGQPSINKDAELEVDPNVDFTPPVAPSIAASAPSSPGNVNAPRLIGTAEAGSTVRIYPSSDCSGTPVTGDATQFGSPGIQVAPVPDNSTTDFTATATDAANNTSPCSVPFTYVEDSVAPGAPTLAATSPASPSSDNDPEVTGSAAAGTSVSLYRNADCSGTPAATGGAAVLEGTGISVNVPANTTTTLTATATDSAGNESPCSNALVYVEDSDAPAPPSLSSTAPGSPANETQPEVIGSAEDGSTVRLYTTSGCTGSPVATGTAAQLAHPGVTVSVADNSTTHFRATSTDAASNTSPCSSARTYVEDSSPPAAPSLTATDPSSPGSSNNPKVQGTAEAGSTVRLYTTNDCSGPPVASGGAGQLAAPGLGANVADNSTTNFRATATDAADNTSPCSLPRTYIEDSVAPATPILAGVSPASPANDNSPRVTGTAEPGSTIRLFMTVDCSGGQVGGGSASELAGAGIAATVPDNATVGLRAQAVDAAGNASGCSHAVQYVELTPPPPTPPPPTGGDDPAPSDPGAGGGGSVTPPPQPPPAAQCVVPKLKGLSKAAAQTALVAARCTLGKITKKKQKRGKSGKVVAHSPGAGQALPAGTPVNLTVSKVKKR